MNLTKRIAAKLKSVYNFRRSRPLPQTEAEVRELAIAVCNLGGFPANESFIHAACTQLMHMSSDSKHLKVADFVYTLRRSICNQSAFNVMQDIKNKSKDEVL